MNRISLFLVPVTCFALLSACSDPPITLDAAVRDAGGRDSGARDAGFVCSAPTIVPPPAAVVCTAADRTCYAAATTTAQITACGNANPACSTCRVSDLLNCATTMGCNDEYGCYEGCAQAACRADGTGPCVGAGEPCATPFNAMLACIQGLGGACSLDTARCFPPLPDAGVPTDAAPPTDAGVPTDAGDASNP